MVISLETTTIWSISGPNLAYLRMKQSYHRSGNFHSRNMLACFCGRFSIVNLTIIIVDNSDKKKHLPIH